MSDISPNPLENDKELRQKIDNLPAGTSPEVIAELCRQSLVDRNYVQRDRYSPDVLIPTEHPPIQKVAKTYVVNGVKTILEANSAEELQERELAFFRSLNLNGADSTQQVDQPRDSETGRFVAAEKTEAEKQAEIYRQTELSLKLRRGELSVQQYLTESGALDQYMRNHGIDLETVRQVAEEKSAAAETAAWERASAEFLETSDWPGGTRNLELLGNWLIEQNREPSVEALREGYEHLKATRALVSNPEVEAHRKLAEARNPQEMQAALDAYRPNGGSSLFGR